VCEIVLWNIWTKKIQSLSSIKEVGLFWGELDDRVFAAARTKNFSMKNCLLTFLTHYSFISWDLFCNSISPILRIIFSKFCLFNFFAWSKVGKIVKSVSSAIYKLFRTRLKKIKQKEKVKNRIKQKRCNMLWAFHF